MLTATDKGTIRIVVVAVALIALACVGGVIALSIAGDAVPSSLEQLAFGSITGLLGLLASTRSGAGAAEAVAAAQAAQVQPLPEAGSTTGSLAPIVVQLPTGDAEAVKADPLPDAGPVDSSAFGADYAVTPVQPSAAALSTATMGSPPAQG